MSYSNGPRIATNGLILCLDAGNSKSYPGTGTSWNDLSGNRNNGTITGLTFNQNDKTFTSISTNITTVPMSGLRPTSGITQEAWVLITNNVVQVFIGSQYGTGGDNSYALWLNNTNQIAGGVNVAGSLNFQFTNQTLTTNTWYYFAHTYNGANQILYLNGRQILSWATTGSILYNANNTLLAVGNDWNGVGYNTGSTIGVQGKLSSIRLYNRGLSASEILQNYNALKGRYGL